VRPKEDDMDRDDLRPIERRIRKMADAGADDVEIAWRFQRTPRTVRNIAAWADVPRRPRTADRDGLRPLERRLLRWRDQGADFEELAAKFRRRPSSLEQVEQLARYKLAR
jgi:DNA-binding CsgD family transcriptional regulator